MTTQNVETILARAMSDAAFAESLFADPAAALAGLDLTAEELASIKGMSRTDFDQFTATAPEERKSMMYITGGGVRIQHNESMLSGNPSLGFYCLVPQIRHDIGF